MGIRESFISRASTRTTVKFNSDGVDMFLQPMSKGTRSRMEAIATDPNRSPSKCSELRWVVLSECIVDSDGDSVLKSEDRGVFDKWDDSFIEPIFEKVMKISKVTDSDKDEFLKN